MVTITPKDALRALAFHVAKNTYRAISKLLYKLFNFEFEAERRWRVKHMQALLDADHKERLGWVGATCR